MTEQTALREADSSPLHEHDLLLLDLDGVVYVGDRAVDGAAAAIRRARNQDARVGFVTNNASRTPDAIAEALHSLGVDAEPSDIVTAAMAAADLLAARYPTGSAILVVGGQGLRAAIADVGLRPVSDAEQQPRAVVQGWSPDVGWTQLAEAMVALAAGADWLATNLDRTLPSPRGPLPGNGSLVAALATASGREPDSAGKPAPALFRTAVDRLGGTRPLMVGDRLETDIRGARQAGFASMAVLTGVATPADLIAAAPPDRPDYLAADLAGVFAPHPPVAVDGDVSRCGATELRWDGARLEVGPVPGPASTDGLDPLRALCGLTWQQRIPPDHYAAALAAIGQR